MEAGLGPNGGTFAFASGPKVCPAATMAHMNIKAQLVTMLRNFKFSTVEGVVVRPQQSVGTVRPIVVGRESLGVCLPLALTRLDHSNE